MNVDDTEAPEVSRDRLIMIFERQEELKTKYHDIEDETGLGLGAVRGMFNLDNARWQYLLKDYAWRVTEELTESTEVEANQTHQWEEAVDALHFLVEMYLICGMSAEDVYEQAGLKIFKECDMLKSARAQCHASNMNANSEPASYTTQVQTLAAYYIVQELGCAMNCLKNKPWKRTQMETDVVRFTKHLSLALRRWIDFVLLLGMNDDDIFDLYFRKSNVNEFRQRSEY